MCDGAASPILTTVFPTRLRQTDVKAGHFERKVQVVETERDRWEQKYEEMAQKYQALQKQLDEFQSELGSL